MRARQASGDSSQAARARTAATRWKRRIVAGDGAAAPGRLRLDRQRKYFSTRRAHSASQSGRPTHIHPKHERASPRHRRDERARPTGSCARALGDPRVWLVRFREAPARRRGAREGPAPAAVERERAALALVRAVLEYF